MLILTDFSVAAEEKFDVKEKIKKETAKRLSSLVREAGLEPARP